MWKELFDVAAVEQQEVELVPSLYTAEWLTIIYHNSRAHFMFCNIKSSEEKTTKVASRIFYS